METILIVLLAFAIIGVIFLLTETLKWKRLYLEADARPAAKSESKPVETKQIKQEKTTPKKVEKSNEKSDKAEKAEKSKQDKELQEAREEIKKLKSKLHDLKGEVKDLKVAEAEAPQPIVDSEGLFELREELAKAKADAAEWKAKAEAKPAKEARKEEKPVVVDAPREVAPAVASVAAPQNDEALKRLQNQLENLKKDHYKVQDELKNLKDRAKKGGRSADKERRRADDNDRAYRITKSQLDVTLERVSYLEGKLAAAGIVVEAQQVPVLTPAPRRAPMPVVDVRDAVKEEVVAEPETQVATPAEVETPEAAPAEVVAPVTAPAAEPAADDVAEPIVRRSASDEGQTIKAKPVSQADLFQTAMVKEEDHGEMQVYTGTEDELEKTSMLGSNALEDVLTPPSQDGDSSEDSSVDDGWANLE